MKRIGLLTLTVLTGTTMLFAQQPQTGTWRRVTDPPPPPQEGNQPVQEAPAQEPTQPVERTSVDAYGNPQQRTDRPPAAARNTAPPYGIPEWLTLKPGTFVTVRMNTGLSSDRNQPGDLFNATLMQPLVVDGIVVAQRGQNVIGRVVEAKKAGRVEGTSRLGLQLTGLTVADGTQANIQSSLVNRNGQTSVGNDVAAVGATTAVGAAVGAAADWGRGAAIGAGAGAAAGLLGVLLTRGRPTLVYPETVLTFRLDSPVNIHTVSAPYAYRYVGPEDYSQPVQTQVQPRPGPRPYGYPAQGPAPYPYYGPYWYGPYAPYPFYGGFGVVVGGYGWRRWR